MDVKGVNDGNKVEMEEKKEETLPQSQINAPWDIQQLYHLHKPSKDPGQYAKPMFLYWQWPLPEAP